MLNCNNYFIYIFIWFELNFCWDNQKNEWYNHLNLIPRATHRPSFLFEKIKNSNFDAMQIHNEKYETSVVIIFWNKYT